MVVNELVSDNKTPPPVHFKFILVGELQAGKTSFIKNLFEIPVQNKSKSEAGVEIYFKKYEPTGGKPFLVSFWDISCSQLVKNSYKLLFEKIDGILYFIDISENLNRESVKYWLKELRENLRNNTNVALILNKTDKVLDDIQKENSKKEILKLVLNRDFINKFNIFEVSLKNELDNSAISNWLVTEAQKRVKNREKVILKAFANDNTYSVLFKLEGIGPNAVFRDFNTLKGVDHIDTFLINLGVALMTAIGQGHDYNIGVYDLPMAKLPNHRLFAFSFRKEDPKANDSRLREGFFIYTLFINKRDYWLFQPFSKAEKFLEKCFGNPLHAIDMNKEFLEDLKIKLLALFKEKASLN